MLFTGSRVLLITALICYCQAIPTNHLGHFYANACVDTMGIIDWDLPEEATRPDDNKQFQLFFNPKPKPGERPQQEQPIMSKYGTNAWEINRVISGFLDRLKAESDGRFTFESSQTKDRGQFRLYISTPEVYYNTTIDFTVFAQDNMFPVATSHNATSDEGEFHYTYHFTQQPDSPACGVRMTPVGGGRRMAAKDCTYPNQTTEESCVVDFSMEDLAGLSGSVEFEVDVLYISGTPTCDLDHKYSFFVTIVPPKELPIGPIVGYVGGPALLIVIVACFVPVMAIKYNKQKNRRIPLERGLKFVDFCIKIIENYGENWRALEGIYRANKAEAQTQRFIEVFQTKNGNLDEDYIEEQALMSAAIKMFLKNEPTPWLPLQLQRDISNEAKTFSTDGKCNVGNIREILHDDSSAKARARGNILGHLMRHFHRVVQLQKEILQQVQEETGNDRATINLVNLTGLATILSPNFFKEAIVEYNDSVSPDMPAADSVMEGMAINARQIDFITLLIDHAPEIFPQHDDRTVVEIGKMDNKVFEKDDTDHEPVTA